MQLFHVALRESVDSILENGLLPRRMHTHRRVWPAQPVHEDAVYLFTSETVARAYHAGAADRLALMEIDAGMLDLSLATMDHEDLAALITTQWLQLKSRLSDEARSHLGSMAFMLRGESKRERDQYVIESIADLPPAIKMELLKLSQDADPTVKRWGRCVYFAAVPAAAVRLIK